MGKLNSTAVVQPRRVRSEETAAAGDSRDGLDDDVGRVHLEVGSGALLELGLDVAAVQLVECERRFWKQTRVAFTS
jgi:hypothetical protein